MPNFHPPRPHTRNSPSPPAGSRSRSALAMHLVVVGNGIAGVTCARLVRKLEPEARITELEFDAEF